MIAREALRTGKAAAGVPAQAHAVAHLDALRLRAGSGDGADDLMSGVAKDPLVLRKDDVVFVPERVL